MSCSASVTRSTCPTPMASSTHAALRRCCSISPTPLLAIREVVRVTRPGGRVGALEMDLGTVLLDHPDRAVTQAVLSASADSMAQPWMGRQLPRLFRQAGLTGVSVDPIVILS